MSLNGTHANSARPALREDCALHLAPDERRWVAGALDTLTARERDVVFAICLGGTNEEMADRLCIALPTLRTHIMRINQKLGATEKADVVRLVAARLADGYRTGRLRPHCVKIVEMKPKTGGSTKRNIPPAPRKSSLAMTTFQPVSGQ